MDTNTTPEPENTSESPSSEQNAESPSSPTKNSEHMIPKSRFDEINDRYKQTQAELEELRQAQQQQREQKLKEQNEYKSLYEEAQQKLSELDQLSEQATRYQDALQATNQARLERIPEERRSLVPEYDDPVKLGQWLDANEALLIDPGKPNPPPADGGAGGQTKNTPTVSAGVEGAMDIARRLGYDVNEDRVSRFARRNQRTDNKD